MGVFDMLILFQLSYVRPSVQECHREGPNGCIRPGGVWN